MQQDDLSSIESIRAVDEERLVHQVYDTALDNSLWPEMIVSIVDHVNRLETMPAENRDQAEIENLNTHFNRAYSISEKMVRLQELNHEQSQVLDAISYNVILLDTDGHAFFSNQTPMDPHHQTPRLGSGDGLVQLDGAYSKRIETCRSNGIIQAWIDSGSAKNAMMLLPKNELTGLGFPAKTETVLVSYALENSKAIEQFSKAHGLRPSENKVLTAFVEDSDLRKVADITGLTYETARKYLKDIFKKSGVTSQTALLQKIFFSPAMVLRKPAVDDAGIAPVRRLLKLSDSRALEYFSLGPEDGYPVLFFDALAGSAIDVVGHPERYLPKLNDLGMRLITPCRPGGFRSTYRPLSSLCDIADDISELCQTLEFERISLLSYSYGSNAALAVAHQLPNLVERITMSSVSYMTYSHKNWREMDLFFQVTNVIGRRWPSLLNRLIPFLARSIMHNVHPFADRSAGNAKCDHDHAILLDHPIRERTRAMLMERTARGMDGVIEEYRINAQKYDFEVSSIQTPMTLLHGEFDVNNPLGGARLLAKHAPNAELHVLPDMGHHHIFLEWDLIFEAALGLPFEIPTPTRRPKSN